MSFGIAFGKSLLGRKIKLGSTNLDGPYQNESKPNGSDHYLSSVISFKENPFKYEHALLKLGIALVNLLEDTEKNVWQSDGKQYSHMK